mgnify:CR=1 FL=1
MNVESRIRKLEIKSLTITEDEIRDVLERRRIKEMTTEERRARIEELQAMYQSSKHIEKT